MNTPSRQIYWRKNIRLMLWLLCTWFAVSFLCGIVFVDSLNQIRLGGYKLGFWFAQQGSMYTFVAIVFYYAWRMNKLDQAHKADSITDTDQQ